MPTDLFFDTHLSKNKTTDSLSWMAVYDSGLQIREIDGVSYADIVRENLKEFWLVDSSEKPRIKIDVNHSETGRNIIFRKRRYMNLDQITKTVYIVGWQKENQFVLLYLYPEGVIELSDSKNDLDLFACEK